MKKFSLQLFLTAIVGMATLVSRAAAPAASSDGTLRDFFASHGFGGAPLQRRFGNHLFVSANMSGRHTGLLIDTGAPITLIDKSSAGTLGLAIKDTKVTAGGVFGKKWERYGVSKVNSIAMGNCTITNVPVALADESDLNYYSRLTHIDGLLGAREMVKFGMVIDCARQQIYISPTGPNAGTSQQLAAFLGGRGFTRIPIRLTGNNHFDVPAAINGHATRLIVDTGATATLLGKEIAVQYGVVPGTFGPGRVFSQTTDGKRVAISGGNVKELQIGDLKIPNAEVMMAPIDSAVVQSKSSGEANAGLLGEDHLSFNFAVIDLGGMALYLRHAD
jgi:predicted aspartyl protease